MLRRTMCVLFAIAAPFLCTTTPIWAAPAQTAAACSAAPKPTAPQGNHWYYRRDRATSVGAGSSHRRARRFKAPRRG